MICDDLEAFRAITASRTPYMSVHSTSMRSLAAAGSSGTTHLVVYTVSLPAGTAGTLALGQLDFEGINNCHVIDLNVSFYLGAGFNHVYAAVANSLQSVRDRCQLPVNGTLEAALVPAASADQTQQQVIGSLRAVAPFMMIVCW